MPLPLASKGLIQIASVAEITAGTDNEKAITPSGLRRVLVPISAAMI